MVQANLKSALLKIYPNIYDKCNYSDFIILIKLFKSLAHCTYIVPKIDFP